MSVPKVETIRRHCDSSLAVELLVERGMLTADEAKNVRRRIHDQQDLAYSRIYGWCRVPECHIDATVDRDGEAYCQYHGKGWEA